MVDETPEAFGWLLDAGTEQSSDQDPPRAQRFDIQLPLHYRASGETAWREGRTANISRTGLRFWTDRLMEAHTQIEMSLELPAEIGGETGVEIMCHGEIVRTVLPASTDAQPSLAAKILEYRFVRGGEKFTA